MYKNGISDSTLRRVRQPHRAHFTGLAILRKSRTPCCIGRATKGAGLSHRKITKVTPQLLNNKREKTRGQHVLVKFGNTTPRPTQLGISNPGTKAATRYLAFGTKAAARYRKSRNQGHAAQCVSHRKWNHRHSAVSVCRHPLLSLFSGFSLSFICCWRMQRRCECRHGPLPLLKPRTCSM